MELEGLAPTVFTGMILADFGAEVTIITRESGMSDVGPPMHLNYMNQVQDIRRPWFLSFSFGRALQNSSIKAWGGK